ncbi:MAG: HDOD domain-containing protein [Rhodoferax sp.]
MNPELFKTLAAAIDSMPTFPKSAQRVLELTRNLECSSKDLVQVIEKDPVLTVKVLRVVNAAYYSLPRPITSVNHAVVYLGFNTIKNLALGIAALGFMPAREPGGFDGKQCLLHSLSTAGIARELALRVDGADPMDCFVAGLLHDFGKLVLAQFMPAQFEQALRLSQGKGQSLHLALREVLGADHAEIGAMLVEKWRFPSDLVETIRRQHGPDLEDTPMIACVFAANQISKKLQFGFGGNPCIEELPAALASRLGGGLDEIVAGLGDLAPVFEEARMFSRI